MGGELSAQQKVHAEELQKILKQNGTGGTSLRELEQLVNEIGSQCPWYPEEGTLNLHDWIKIGIHLHSPPQASRQHLLLWRKCKEAIEVVETHRLKAPSPFLSLLPEEGGPAYPPPYMQLTLLAEPSYSTAFLPIAPLQEPDSAVKAESVNAKAALAKQLLPSHVPPVTLSPKELDIGQDSSAPLLNNELQIPSGEAVSPFQKMVEPRKNSGSSDLDDLEFLAAYPISQTQDQNSGAAHEWSPQSYAAMKELQALRDTGAENKEVKGMLEGSNSEGQHTTGQLAGIKDFATVQLPPKVLAISSDCAILAFPKMPSYGQTEKGFATIQKELAEPYCDSVNGLQTALAQQDGNPEAATEFFIKLAKDNKDCQQALQQLMASRNFTWADVLRVCQDIEMSVAQLVLLPFAVPNPADIEPDGIDVQWIGQTVTIQWLSCTFVIADSRFRGPLASQVWGPQKFQQGHKWLKGNQLRRFDGEFLHGRGLDWMALVVSSNSMIL